MAINIQMTYRSNTKINRYTEVEIAYYTKDGHMLTQQLMWDLGNIAELACEIMTKHRFIAADVTAKDTNEILMQLERAAKRKRREPLSFFVKRMLRKIPAQNFTYS